MKHDELLLPMRRIVHRIEIKSQPSGWSGERSNEVIDECITQPPERRDGNRVLEPRQSGLAGQIVIVGTAPSDQFEHWIAAQRIVIVLVLVASHDAIQPRPQHFREAMSNQLWSATIIQCVDEALGKTDGLIKLTEGQQSGIAGEICLTWLDNNRRRREKIEHTLPKQTVYS